MKKRVLKNVIASSLIALSVITILPATQAQAAWRRDNQGWWYTEGNSYVKGAWRQIDGNWYYFYSNGYMAHDTYIGTYYVNSNGVWSTPPTNGSAQNQAVQQIQQSDPASNSDDPFAALDVIDDGGHSAEDPAADAQMAEWNK